MLVHRLIHRFRLLNAEPDAGGTGTGAPPADITPGPDAGAAPAAPAAATEPADPLAGLQTALDAVGADPAADPAPGQPRDAMGRFAPVDPNAAPAAPAAPGAQAPAAPVPAAPKPGEIDLTPPEGMNERSQQRWAQLTERVKQVPELERRATEAQTALDSVRQMVAGSGLAQEEFSDMLGMARLFKSTNPQEMRAALQQLDGLRADLATRMGVDVPGVDPLAAHPDLKADVDGMLMTRERALEIARLRQGNQQAQQITQEQRELQQHQQAIQQASQSMDAALNAKAGTPGHQEKLNYIGNHFKNPENMQAFVKTYRPDQWAGVVMAMYDAYQPPAPAPAVPQPLRPTGMRPGAPVQNGPVTAESAVSNAFASIGM